MEEKDFFRQVYSIDTRAGKSLRHMLTKARWCHRYAISINYFEVMADKKCASDVLSYAFLWYRTPEGSEFWKTLYKALLEQEIPDGVLCI